MDAAERRLARVAAHLVPSFPVTHAATFPLVPAPTAASSSSSSSSSPAGDSYRRVHGDVPSEPPEWRAATDESGKEFVDIIYEKAVGEGIAKVTRSSSIGYPCVKFWAPGKKKKKHCCWIAWIWIKLVFSSLPWLSDPDFCCRSL
jgi:hypothetical protein